MAKHNFNPHRSPFAELPSLPADFTDAFEGMKLAIMRRKGNWHDVSPNDARLSLEALIEFIDRPITPQR